MSNKFGWDYSPGVTGREPEIAGYDECPKCGEESLQKDYDGDFCLNEACSYSYTTEDKRFDAATAKWEEREGR